jgi:chorismate mutase
MQFNSIDTWLPALKQPLLISGPCGAESFEQLHQTAKELTAIKAVSLFRAGVWKPRTRPNAFEGKGEEALKWLKDIQQEFGFKITVEVANAYHTELALKYGIDVLWIGARTTVNFYGKTKYRNKPLWQLPIELRTLFPDLPIICDPSHICGNRELIPHVAQKALDLGMNGLMIESHFNPAIALSDAAQQFTPQQLNDLLQKLIIRNTTVGELEQKNKLDELRKIIDEIDDDIINALKKRIQVIEQIGAYKKEHNIAIFQLQRWQEILRTRGQWADKMGLSRQHIEKLCQLLHEESIRVQNALMNTK